MGKNFPFPVIIYYFSDSFINTNHIKFNVLELFDNMIRENDLYIEMDDELNVAMQFKGTKCILLSNAPTRAELDMC